MLTSKLVAAGPGGTTVGRSCGCCADAAVQLWLYAERHGERVYADPPYVCVGEGNPTHGEEWDDRPRDVWSDGWLESVRKAWGDDAARFVAARHPARVTEAKELPNGEGEE